MKRKSISQDKDEKDLASSLPFFPTSQISAIFDHHDTLLGHQLGLGGGFTMQSKDQLDLNNFSFDSQLNFDHNVFQQSPWVFAQDDSPIKSDVAVVPALTVDKSDFTNKQYELRGNRNANYIKDLVSFDNGDHDVDEDEEEEGEEEDDEKDEKPVSQKKRPYYRKNKHPKEVLEKVEAERLKKKRIKNRELAARSRRKKKERMANLEDENEALVRENARLKAIIKSCATCKRY